MRARRAAWLVAGFLCVGCASSAGTDSSAKQTEGSRRAPATPAQAPSFDNATAVLEGDEGSVRIDLQIAETPAQRAFGLMRRKRLPADAGMAFLFARPTTSGFYMKNTPLPLSIAFFDDDGKILRILDMQPCREPACRVYYPDVAYTGALEVNRGSFARWGIDEGDTIEINR